MKLTTRNVIIPGNLSPKPSLREIEIAYILADFFHHDITFVLRKGHKTADYLIGPHFWELKSLEGKGKRTVQHAMHRAARQSENIVIDTAKSKLHLSTICSRLQYEWRFMPKIKRVLVASKNDKIIELSK